MDQKNCPLILGMLSPFVLATEGSLGFESGDFEDPLYGRRIMAVDIHTMHDPVQAKWASSTYELMKTMRCSATQTSLRAYHMLERLYTINIPALLRRRSTGMTLADSAAAEAELQRNWVMARHERSLAGVEELLHKIKSAADDADVDKYSLEIVLSGPETTTIKNANLRLNHAQKISNDLKNIARGVSEAAKYLRHGDRDDATNAAYKSMHYFGGTLWDVNAVPTGQELITLMGRLLTMSTLQAPAPWVM